MQAKPQLDYIVPHDFTINNKIPFRKQALWISPTTKLHCTPIPTNFDQKGEKKKKKTLFKTKILG